MRQRKLTTGRTLRHSLGMLFVAALSAACDKSTRPGSLVGTWVATTFQITEAGQAPVDVLAAGGSLTITIAPDMSTTGLLTIPGSVVGGSDVSVSMAGTVILAGNTVEFQQLADSFVRDLGFRVSGRTMRAGQTIAGVALDLTLTRQ